MIYTVGTAARYSYAASALFFGVCAMIGITVMWIATIPKMTMRNSMLPRGGGPDPRVNLSISNPMVSVIEVTELCFPPAPTFNPLPSCIPTSGACVESAAELQEAVSQAMEGDTIAICGGATMDTSATGQKGIFQTGLTLCCAGGRGDCVFKNDGTSRNLYVKADAISMRATSTFMEASLPDHIVGGTSICGRWARLLSLLRSFRVIGNDIFALRSVRHRSAHDTAPTLLLLASLPFGSNSEI